MVSPLSLDALPQVAEYYHLDALGSVRVITNEAGTVLRRHDYQPFREEIPQNPPQTPSSTDKRLFTGQERDFETGLDYFNARYLSTATGRFTTPDPVGNVPEALSNAQAYNRYAYAYNNPLRYLDVTGLWPARTWWDVHGQIFALAFPGLSPDALSVMASASRWADIALYDIPEVHAMREPGESLTIATIEWRAFIDNWRSNASLTWSQGLERNAYWDFGLLGHAISDRYAPSHGDFGIWSPPDFTLSDPLGGWWYVGTHVLGERSLQALTPEALQGMLDYLREAGESAFGLAWYVGATGLLPKLQLPSVKATWPDTPLPRIDGAA